MKKIFMCATLFLSILKIYCQVQDRTQNDRIVATNLIYQNIISLQEGGVSKDDIISFYDDVGKIVIICRKNKKFKAIKMHYKEKKCDKAKRQKLSKLDKQNLSIIFTKPDILSKISNSNCDQSVHSFNTVYFKTGTFRNTFFSHCEQNDEVKPLVSLYFSLRK